MWTRRLSERALVVALVGLALTAARETRAAPPAATSSDPMADYRERFKLGMERYKAGALADAIAYWEPIYREMGPTTGYRLAYNLGVAYMEFKDATRAAERLKAFLDEVDARRQRNDKMEPRVMDEESDARTRFAYLSTTKGRIQVGTGTKPVSAAVDADQPRLAGFVSWVTPGDHTVTFDPGAPDAEEKHVTVQAGQVLEVDPSPPQPAASASNAAPSASAGSTSTSSVPPAPTPVATHETVRPFSPVFLYVTGGLAVAAGIALVPLYASGKTQFDGDSRTPSPANSSSYYSFRTLYEADMVGSVALGVVTAALVTWYFLGSKERDVGDVRNLRNLVVTPMGVSGRF
jgi:hypothetical protein